MEIKTKLSINDKCFFIMNAKVWQATVIDISTYTKGSETNVTYTIDKNPCSSRYTCRFSESDLFG